jgi:hypothetical protein
MKESIEARISRYLAGEMDEQEKAGFQHELAQSCNGNGLRAISVFGK